MNDSCALATTIPSLPFTDVLNTSAAANGTKIGTCNAHAYNNVWYRFLAVANLPILVTSSFSATGTNYDTVITVWTGDSCDSLIQLCCNNVGYLNLTGGSNLEFAVIAGTTYYIQVSALNSGGGNNLSLLVKERDLVPDGALVLGGNEWDKSPNNFDVDTGAGSFFGDNACISYNTSGGAITKRLSTSVMQNFDRSFIVLGIVTFTDKY